MNDRERGRKKSEGERIKEGEQGPETGREKK